jgi:hypothetical protein
MARRLMLELVGEDEIVVLKPLTFLGRDLKQLALTAEQAARKQVDGVVD